MKEKSYRSYGDSPSSQLDWEKKEEEEEEEEEHIRIVPCQRNAGIEQ